MPEENILLTSHLIYRMNVDFANGMAADYLVTFHNRVEWGNHLLTIFQTLCDKILLLFSVENDVQWV